MIENEIDAIKIGMLYLGIYISILFGVLAWILYIINKKLNKIRQRNQNINYCKKCGNKI